MKTLSIEQMENVNGGRSRFFESFACNMAAGGIGAIYTGAIAGAVGVPVGAFVGGVVGLAWSSGLSALIC